MFQSKLFGISLRTSLILALTAIAPVVNAATNIVTTATDDSNPGCLRQVISNSVSGDTIIFAPALSGATIRLTNYVYVDLITNSALVVDKSLTIDASALPGGILIDGNHTASVFTVNAGTNVFTGLTITNGYVDRGPQGWLPGDGGGILNNAVLTLNRCIFLGNTAIPNPGTSFPPPLPGHGGGGVANFGMLTVNECFFTGNNSALYNDTLMIVNKSTISGNSGIAIQNGRSCPKYCVTPGARLTVNQCTITENLYAVYTVSTNPVFINQSTLVEKVGRPLDGYFTLSNSIVAGTNWLYSTFTNNANNLITTSNVLLSPLGYYGGPTPTMPPLPGSPAIDNGNDSLTNIFATDQRGAARFSNLHVDLGAVESAITPTDPPLATTLPATGLGLTTVTLNALVNQNSTATTCYFQYGTTTDYGFVTPIIPLSTSIATISHALTGLSPGTLYHFRIVATNSLGTAFGNDLTFKTGIPRIISNNNDSGPGSLRDVVASFALGDSITIASNLSGQTILLTQGQITLNDGIILDASALPAPLTINGNHVGRIFQVTNNATVFLDSLIITNGNASGNGGGINNQGTLTLNRCTVGGSSSSSGGGGIYNASTLTLTRSTVANNVASTSGGGIWNNGSLTLSQSTLSGNSASDYGGGLAAYSPALLYQCTLARNHAGSYGGGIYDLSFVLLSQSTISSNTAPGGGGGICDEYNGALTLFNSIVAGNTGPDILQFVNAIYIPIQYSGLNITNGDPMLAPLGAYDGPTQTMPPLLGSPAVDNGSDTATNTYSLDQRDLPRLVGSHVDIGAAELAFPLADPLVQTKPATAIDTNLATLNATIIPNGLPTTYYFLFGTNTNYTAFSPPAVLTAGPASVASTVTGLLASTTYHFRAVATNTLGISYGTDLSFQTRNPIHIVTNTNDGGPGSLRDAVANFFTGDTIVLSTNLSGQTIVLTSGQLSLNYNTTLDASTLPGGLIIDGHTNGRIFQISTGATNVFNSLTITNGKASDLGGGIYNQGALTLNNCTITRNAAPQGGGIYNMGTLNLNACSISGNSAATNGGGIDNSGALLLNQSTVSANSAGNYGGGIRGHSILKQSTVSGNTASIGGGIYDGSVFTSEAYVYQSTVSANSATVSGGGIYLNGNNGSLSMSNSIVAGNSSSTYADLRYTDDSVGFYFEFLGANLTNGNPQLSPLGNFGGPTLTMPPLVDSPAIDGCSNGTSFATDQRGSPRFSGLYTDIGAVESSFPPAIPLALTQPAVVLGSNSAILNAYFAPHGVASTSYIQYGTNTNYSDSTTPLVLTAGASRSITVTGLVPMTIYHFRAVATNNLGRGNGQDLTFQTGGFPNRVSNTNDNGAGSLRDAVENFNIGSSITFDPALAGKTIVLTSGPIILDQSLSIDASVLSQSVALDGNQNGRIFSVTNNTNVVVVLDSLTIKNGKVVGDHGGGIYSGGNLTLNRCTVAGNDTSMNGGGIYNGGRLTLNSSTIAGNTASTNGGGIFNQGLLVLNASTVCSNSAAFSGGGLYNLGGIAFSTFNQSTFSGNNANMGGGLFLAFGLLMDQCTISANYATNGGGGLYNTNNSLPRITNSIFTGNFGPVSPDILWLGSTAVLAQWSANLTNGNPMLAPLGNYGGPTLTMPPLPGSPAVDGCTGGTHFATDQRGFPRIIDGNGDLMAVADIGAVEGFPYPNGPGTLVGLKKLDNGSIQFGFSNYTGGSYTVFASADLAAPLNTWSNLGPAVEMPVGSGQYQFTDPGATNAQRFYRVRSP